MNQSIVNLTPHAITILSPNGDRIFPPDGTVARVSQTTKLESFIDGIEIHAPRFGDVVGLPRPVEGVHFIVSAMVKAACPGRKDLLSPGELVRDVKGNVIGCKNFFC